MTRTDAENTINQNIKDNTTRDISPAKVRTSMGAILDWVDFSNSAGVETVSANANKKYTIPAGKLLEKIVVIPSAAIAGFGVGTTDGGFEISPALPVADSSAELFSLNIYANADKDIWFNGITSSTTIKIYLR